MLVQYYKEFDLFEGWVYVVCGKLNLGYFSDSQFYFHGLFCGFFYPDLISSPDQK